MFDTGQSWGKLFCLLFTFVVTFMPCQVSARPVGTGSTGGMANDGYPPSNNEDIYLRFRPRTRLSGIQTEDKVPAVLLQDVKENTFIDDANDTNNLPSNVPSNALNDMQSGKIDENEPNIPSNKNKEQNFVKLDNEDGAYPSVSEVKEQGFDGDLNNDDVMSEVLSNETPDREQSQGSNVAPIVGDTAEMLHEIITGDVDVIDSIITTEGDLKQENGSEAVKPETSTGSGGDNDEYLVSSEDVQPDDIDDLLNALGQMMSDGLDEEGNGHVITGIMTKVFVYPDGNVMYEGRHDPEKFLYEPTGISEPREMTQSSVSKENTNDDEQKSGYQGLPAMLDLNQIEANGINEMDGISGNIISDVESLARPFLKIVQGVLNNDENDVISKIAGYTSVDDPTLAVEENNRKRDDSMDFPLQTVNEIEIIYSL